MAQSSAKRCNKNISQQGSTGESKSSPVLSRPIQTYPRVGHRVGLPRSRKIQPIPKVMKNKENPPNPFGFGGVWWRLLDSNQWPHACEYSIGEATACFPLHLGLLCPDLVVLGCCPVRCLHTDISCSGSGCGSAGRTRFLVLAVDSRQFCLEPGNILRHGIPHDAHVHTVIPMHDSVSQTVYLLPWDAGDGLFYGIA